MPSEQRLTRGRPFHGNLRDLPYVRPVRRERLEREPPPVIPTHYPSAGSSSPAASKSSIAKPAGAAPAPATSFDGLDFENWGDGHPPDTNGDVGPTYYIQTVNTSVGIYDKGTGALAAAFTFDTFMSQGAFGNLCDTDNFGDPYVLYDSFEDRWIVTDFAFKQDSFGNVANPPGAFQCFAVSMSGDPVGGGWNFYSINTAGGAGDYPKFGIWPDGLYMSTNMFDYAAAGSFQNVRVYAFNKFQMYAGAASAQAVSFDLPAVEFTVLPANARLQAGTPPAGRPNLYAVVWQFTNAESVYKFHVDWNAISTSTLTGPDITIAPADWADPPLSVPSLGGNNLDTLAVRTMAQNQYTNLGGTESLWTSHTVQGISASQAAVRFYQVDVTGGTVAASTTQAFTHNPDSSMNRFMPSLAVDRAGNMVIGYSTSNSSTKPAIKYAGRLAGDAQSSLPQTEQLLRQGLGTQTGNCSGSACIRWGDYSAAALDPDGCKLWLTNEYYDADGLSWLTRIGAFQYPSCTPVGSGGTIQGTVTATSGGAPIAGATVSFGSRTATSNGSGFYSFANIPAGTYPGISASATGFVTSASSVVVVTDGGTTVRDFSLASAPQSGCLTDTTQADFQAGVPSFVDLTSSPGDVKLGVVPGIDQQNTTVSNTGNTISTSVWEAQTFTPSVSGPVTRIDADLFCSSCSGTNPAITVELRTTSSGLPTSTVLASTTMPGFSSGVPTFYSASFGSPAAVSAGTVYAFVLRLAADRATGAYAALRSNNNQYGGGAQAISTNGGGSWSAQNRDLGFKAFVATLASSGDFVSSLKDANPSAGHAASWTTISWNASVPAGTDLKFQAAARNDLLGVFNFVGPDGTPATFFSSGGSLSQFNGFRYLKYKASLTTGNTNSPIVNDVTVCFTDAAATPTPTRTPTRTSTNTPTSTPTPTLTPTPQVVATALSVDAAADGGFSDGNGIFEPGERVIVKPSWKNNGGTIDLTGALSNFTGPAGPVYTIQDASGAYGSIAPGATAQCSDCYEVGVNAPASRPATHWDTTVTETLSGGQGSKVWTLHVGQSFTDVPKSYVFYQFIENLLHFGVTAGCTLTTYCPDDSVFRLQMAIFIGRAQAGGDANVPVSGTAQGSFYNCVAGGVSLFIDVAPDDPFCRHVHYIYGTGVTAGCVATPPQYCPTDIVSRGQMSIFIARAVAGSDAAVPLTYGPDPVTGRSYSCDPAAPSLFFTDVTTSDLFCRHAHFLWAKNVISGFADGTFGPALDVSRGAMSKFISNGFGYSLYSH